MILIGIDDTDTLDSPGTNQQARAIIAALRDVAACRFVLRHQLLFDPRVPYTSKNGSASIELAPQAGVGVAQIADVCRCVLRSVFVHGSDPGLCVVERVPADVVEFGLACQQRIVDQAEAFVIADRHNLLLEGLGGTCGGVIGALAAVGLASTGGDGRVVVHGEHEEIGGMQTCETLHRRQITVQEIGTNRVIEGGEIDVGKKLRPNRRGGGVVLFVEWSGGWRAVKCV